MPCRCRRSACRRTWDSRPGAIFSSPIGPMRGFAARSPSSVGGFPPLQGNSPARRAVLGANKFELAGKDTSLFVHNAAEEGTMLAAMKRGGSLLVKASSKRGNETTDRFSLAGIAARSIGGEGMQVSTLRQSFRKSAPRPSPRLPGSAVPIFSPFRGVRRPGARGAHARGPALALDLPSGRDRLRAMSTIARRCSAKLARGFVHRRARIAPSTSAPTGRANGCSGCATGPRRARKSRPSTSRSPTAARSASPARSAARCPAASATPARSG